MPRIPRSRRGRRSFRQRDNDFRVWSGVHGFPLPYQRFAEDWNEQMGLPRHDSAGYRAFYWWYVHRIELSDIEEILDENDT